MASVRNLTVFDIMLPNWIVVPAKGAVACENDDLTGAEVFRFLQTSAGGGTLEFTLDPPPLETTEPAEEPIIAAVAEPETQAPPPASKASKG